MGLGGLILLIISAAIGGADEPDDTQPLLATPRSGTHAPATNEETSPAAAVVGQDAPEESEAPSSAEPTPTPDLVTDEPEPSPEPEEIAEPTTALAALALLEVRPRDPKDGYDRDLFAYRSVDLDRNGCDTRNDILGRDLRDTELKPGTRDCVVERGLLHDPYTGKAIVFERGDGNLIHIDHVVALSDAWQKGAQHLDEDALHGLGNDPLNLLAVYAPANSQKGDGDAATWLPSNKPYRCQYVARQVAVKRTYGLWVVQPERDAIERILRDCPDEPLPVAGDVPRVPTPTETIAPKPPPTAEPTPTPTPRDQDVYYKNCTEAREAGVTPILRGDPGYGRHLDRDGDGVACE